MSQTSAPDAVNGGGTAAAPATPTPLELALDRVRSAEDFPAVSGRIQQLMALLGDEDMSVQRLANFLLQDYGLTLKLLRTANSFRFNRSGVPVVSATHAIVMMGVHTVRDIVSSIVVFEHYGRRSPGLRELLMLSLLSANHAREVAERTGGIRGEEAYLLGMLRNLGEVLVACYLPEKYAAVLRDVAAHRCTAGAACRRVLHFTYEQLASAVVRDWHIPDVERVLTEVPDRSRNDRAHLVVSFAHSLTAAVYRQPPEQSRHAVSLLLQKYPVLRLDREEVAEVLDAGLAGTSETFAHARVKLNQLQLKHQIAAALGDAPEPAAARDGKAPAASPEHASRSLAAVQRAIDEGGFDLNKLLLVILETTITAGAFDRAALALVGPTRQEVCGRFALGRESEGLMLRFRFPLGPGGGPLGLAVSRGQELTIAGEWELLPEEARLLRTLGAGALALLPLVVGGRTIGALYVDTCSPDHPGDAALGVARQMRDAIAAAMTRRHPMAGAPAGRPAV